MLQERRAFFESKPYCKKVVEISALKKSGIEEAMDDISHGRVTEYKCADEMFEKLGI